MRPRRHREQSAPTAGKMTSRMGHFFSLFVLVTSDNFGRWQKNQMECALVQNPHGMKSRNTVEGCRGCSLGGWNPSFANH